VKVGDLVRIRQGTRDGKLGFITVLTFARPHIVEVMVEGISYGYYRRDLEVISESR